MTDPLINNDYLLSDELKNNRDTNPIKKLPRA